MIGCHNIKFKKYDDKNLNIGIIGEISKVRKDNITFNKIGFEDLEEENILKMKKILKMYTQEFLKLF